MKKENYIELPKLKQSKSQGKIGYIFLELIDKRPFRKIAEVRSEFRPLVIKDKETRAKESEGLMKSFSKQMSTKFGEEKLFDSEYCRLLDYFEAFDFVSTQQNGSQQEVTLNTFGSLLLHNCKKNRSNDIFDGRNKDILARVYLFVDNFKKWNLLQVIKKNNKLNINDLISQLISLKIGCDLEKTKKDIIAKPEFENKLRVEWEKGHTSKTIDYSWRREKIENLMPAMVEERQQHYISSLLSLYEDVGLVIKENNKLSCNVRLMDSLRSRKIWLTSEDISLSDFFEETYKIYKFLSHGKSVGAIPIPFLRKNVCLKLNILWPTFDKILTNYSLGYNTFDISLTRASIKRKWGLNIDSKSFYYITMKKKGELNVR